MDLIDRVAFVKEMKTRQNAVEAAIENANAGTYYTDKEHWEGVFCTFAEVKLTLDNMPTVPAVPLGSRSREELLRNIKIMHVWASFAVEHHDFALTDAMLKSMEIWTKELIEWMKEGQHDHDEPNQRPARSGI